jgi:iron-sulfur cluster repair protein YtfE (RIC family)
MLNLSALMREHTELIRRSMKLGQLTAAAEPDQIDELMAVLHEFSDLLIGHLQEEDSVLYPALCADARTRLAQTAQTFVAEMGDHADLWLGYYATWSRGTILKDWHGFRRATEEMLDRISHRIVRENRVLFPLIDRGKDRAAA